MIVSGADMRRSLRRQSASAALAGAPRARAGRPGKLALLAVLGIIVSAAWFGWLYAQIEFYAHADQAHSAGAIAVFGAAEYEGRPSPVLRARLAHALELYRRGLAPMIITLGGGGDRDYSEGGVGRDYLLAHGVPEDAIVAETESGNTEESVRRLAAILRENGISSVIAVSDGTHLFRIHALCRSNGIAVYTSPRLPGRPIGDWSEIKRLGHEMAGYTLWRLGLH